MRKEEMSLADYATWAGVLIAAVAIAGWLFLGTWQTSNNTTEEFLSNLQTGQYLRVQDSLTKETYQMMVMFYGKITASVVKPHYRPGKMKEYSFNLIEKTNKSARYKVRIMDPLGNMTTDTIDLTKQDGDWKVSNF